MNDIPFVTHTKLFSISCVLNISYVVSSYFSVTCVIYDQEVLGLNPKA